MARIYSINQEHGTVNGVKFFEGIAMVLDEKHGILTWFESNGYTVVTGNDDPLSDIEKMDKRNISNLCVAKHGYTIPEGSKKDLLDLYHTDVVVDPPEPAKVELSGHDTDQAYTDWNNGVTFDPSWVGARQVYTGEYENPDLPRGLFIQPKGATPTTWPSYRVWVPVGAWKSATDEFLEDKDQVFIPVFPSPDHNPDYLDLDSFDYTAVTLNVYASS